MIQLLTFTCQQGNFQNPSNQASTLCEPRTSRCISWIQKRQRNQRSNYQHLLDHRKTREFQKNFCFIDCAKAFDCVDHSKQWKILQEMEIPYQLTCLLRNLMQVKKQQLELDVEQWTGSKSGKEYNKAVYCHPAYLTFMECTSCKILGWMNHNLQSRFLGEISTTSDVQIIPPNGRK